MSEHPERDISIDERRAPSCRIQISILEMTLLMAALAVSFRWPGFTVPWSSLPLPDIYSKPWHHSAERVDQKCHESLPRRLAAMQFNLDSQLLRVFLGLVLGASYLAVYWQSYKLDSAFQLSRMRRYLGLAALAGMTLFLAATFLAPTRNPARQRFEEILVLVSLAVLVPVVAFLTQRRIIRINSLPNWAQSHGFTVISRAPAEAEETLPEDLRRLPLFRQGYKPATRFLMKRDERKVGLQTLVFDYEWQEYSTMWWFPLGSTPRVRRATVVAFHRTELHLPAFELRSTDVTRKPLDDDPPWVLVELPEHPRFSAQFTLCAQDIAALQHVFSHDLINALERRRGWCLEGLGPWLIAYHQNAPKAFALLQAFSGLKADVLECTEPDDLEARLNTARHLLLKLMTAKR